MNKPARLGGADHIRIAAERSICSYTNDVARGRKPCQAGGIAKKPGCRIKTHLPRAVVYKAGSGRAPFRSKRNGALSFVLTRFLHANRGPLRWKTPWSAARAA